MIGYNNYKCKFCGATMSAQEIIALASQPLYVTHYPYLNSDKEYTKVYLNDNKNVKFKDLLYIHCPNCEKDSIWEIEKN